jgi:hypothetical protein
MRLCECGCGGQTPRVQRSSPARGYVVGDYHRFVRGHQHRNAHPKGYKTTGSRGENQRVHRVRAERALGRPLPPRAVVHHADGSIRADAPLVICQDQAYHRLLHYRMRIQRAGGNPNTEKICTGCRQVKARTQFAVERSAGDGQSLYCLVCSRAKRNSAYARHVARQGRAVRPHGQRWRGASTQQAGA